jgi:hypothetical protein
MVLAVWQGTARGMSHVASQAFTFASKGHSELSGGRDGRYQRQLNDVNRGQRIGSTAGNN